MAFLSPNLNVMIKAAKKAARGLLRDFGELEELQVSQKGVSDFVSTADLRSESILKHELQKARPDYGFLLEEEGVVEGSDKNTRWIIDPLDGTTNFLHGIPMFAISIALQQNDEIIAGVIYNPALDELFFAEKGNGAFMATARGDKRLRVSSRKNLEHSIIATGAPFNGHGNIEIFLNQTRPVLSKTAGIRRMGSASIDLAYVASGKFDAFWEMELKTWDIAAGILLVKEAGGHILEIGRKDVRSDHTKSVLESGNIIASNSGIIKAISDTINEVGV